MEVDEAVADVVCGERSKVALGLKLPACTYGGLKDEAGAMRRQTVDEALCGTSGVPMPPALARLAGLPSAASFKASNVDVQARQNVDAVAHGKTELGELDRP